MENVIECYNLVAYKEEDPHSVNIPEYEGSHDVQGPVLDLPKITEKLKIKKINIGTKADHKFSSIGDYSGDENVGHIANLL